MDEAAVSVPLSQMLTQLREASAPTDWRAANRTLERLGFAPLPLRQAAEEAAALEQTDAMVPTAAATCATLLQMCELYEARGTTLERALAEAPPEVKRDSSEDEVERGPFTDEKPAFVVTCKRCGGDVAGPKNSTCVCSVPLLGEEGPSMADQASSEAKRVWRSMTKSLFSPSAPPPPPKEASSDAPEAETPPPVAER